MPTWNEVDAIILERVSKGESVEKACDELRAEYLKNLSDHVSRPVITYYSGFLQKPPHPTMSINDFDMNGFMAVIHNIECDKGLDLVLHTPGGGTEATRALVEYIYSKFGKDIRVIVPQLAMSAGTMIACASNEIIMGKHSSLGPTDPQVNGVPAMGVISEIKKAIEEIRSDPLKQALWQEVFRQLPPAFISSCERSIAGTQKMVEAWLAQNMFVDRQNPTKVAKLTLDKINSYEDTTEHGHHFLREACIEFGLNVSSLEDDQDLQEHVLSLHHAYVASFARLRSFKFIENSIGASWNVSLD